MGLQSPRDSQMPGVGTKAKHTALGLVLKTRLVEIVNDKSMDLVLTWQLTPRAYTHCLFLPDNLPEGRGVAWPLLLVIQTDCLPHRAWASARYVRTGGQRLPDACSRPRLSLAPVLREGQALGEQHPFQIS